MIERVRMRHFRRFDDQKVDFGPGVNLIEGINNSGKSTILYAIEYGLFGHVRGFKKKSEYTMREQPDAGVELVFKGNDGRRYRLMRFHKLKVASSKVSASHFTLKRFVSDKDEGEEYILSSDFGNTEEELALKVRELIGMSRRLFEVTVSARQGELPDLLKGSDALDIVLGVTAADALTEAFRERKRTLEKNLSQMPVLESLLERLTHEKGQIETEGKRIGDEITTVSKTVKDLEESNKSILEIGASIDKLESIRRDWDSSRQQLELSATSKRGVSEQLENKKYTGSLDSWKEEMASAETAYQEAIKALEQHRSESKTIADSIASTQQELGTLRGRLSSLGISADELETQGEKIGTRKSLEKDKNQTEKDILDLRKTREEVQLQIGDIDGQLSRRKSVQDTQECEYCGAELDPVKVKEDVTKLTKDLKKLKTELKKASTSIEKKEQHMIKIEKTFTILEALELKKSVDKIERELATLQKDNEKMTKKNDTLISAQTEARVAAEDKKAAFSEISELVRKLEELERQEVSLLKEQKDAKASLKKITEELRGSIASQKSDFSKSIAGALKKVDLKSDTFPPEFRQVEELVVERRTELRVNLERERATLSELKDRKKEQSSRSMQIDTEISSTTSQLDNLAQMKSYAEKYEKLAGAFKDVQSQIRETASADLSKSTLQLHQNIFPDSEVTDVRIRPEDYSVEVQPRDWDEMVPATVYQGGGMQLLLGIAYRLAIGEFVRGVPFLFADEPTYGADVENRKKILSSFQKMSMTPQTLLVTHQSDSLEFTPKNRVEVVVEGERSIINTMKVKPEKKPAAKKPATAKKKSTTKKTKAKTSKAVPKKKTTTKKRSPKGGSSK